MPGTIAIIAPFIDTSQYNMDYTLRLRTNGRELTLAAFYEWANEGFKAENISRGVDYGEDIPSAGFYLQGLLHQQGYRTVLTNRYDTGSLKSLAGKDLFAVCISTTMIISTESFVALLEDIREIMPGVPVIAGGVLVWKSFYNYLNHMDAPGDFPLVPGMMFHPENSAMKADVLVVAQHGITSLLQVLKELEKGRAGDFNHIPNLCLPGKGGFVFTKIVEEKVDYNEDITRWDLIPEMPEKIPVRTSIGCPYRCRFCDFCRLFPKVFLRSGESLQKELQLARQSLGQKPAMLHVTDDNVFITKRRLFEVCGAISESGLNYWAGFMRGGEYTAEELDAIKRSGLMMGKIGVESGDQGQLDRMNKRQKADKMKRGIEQLDANGISTLLTFVVGFPGETEQTLDNTANFLNELQLENLAVGYQVYPLTIMPLSELAGPEARKKWQIQGIQDQWTHYTMNSGEAVSACHALFKRVINVPYSYSEESYFFNRGMFDLETRRSLFQLRQQLTINLIGNSPWSENEHLIRQMTRLMELPEEGIGERLRGEIVARVENPSEEKYNNIS